MEALQELFSSQFKDHEARVEGLASLIRCDECSVYCGDSFLGTKKVYRYELGQLDRDHLICESCRSNAEAAGQNTASMKGPLSPAEVLEHEGILMSTISGRTFLPNSVIARATRSGNIGDSDRGESLSFRDAIIVLLHADIKRRQGYTPFDDAPRMRHDFPRGPSLSSSYNPTPSDFARTWHASSYVTPESMGLKKRDHIAPDVMDPSFNEK